MAIKIITTEDGSQSLFDEELNETYHSTRGAKGESLHVFIKEGLDYFVKAKKVDRVNILEVGLGTGLNALLTSNYTKENQIKVSFTSLEPFPIEKEIYQNLNYHQSEKDHEIFMNIHESEWEEPVEISEYFLFAKYQEKLEHFGTTNFFNIVYFDAFAPSKQAEVWSESNLKKCFDLLEDEGILTTYCAQGQFKRNLDEVGFEVETLQGAMGKKEMVRAKKPITGGA